MVCKEEMTRQQELIQGLESARDDLNLRLNDLIAQESGPLTASSEEKSSNLVEEILAEKTEINPARLPTRRASPRPGRREACKGGGLAKGKAGPGLNGFAGRNARKLCEVP